MFNFIFTIHSCMNYVGLFPFPQHAGVPQDRANPCQQFSQPYCIIDITIRDPSVSIKTKTKLYLF